MRMEAWADRVKAIVEGPNRSRRSSRYEQRENEVGGIQGNLETAVSTFSSRPRASSGQGRACVVSVFGKSSGSGCCH